MSLIKTGRVDDADEMLDIAFRAARQRRDAAFEQLTGKNRLIKGRATEKERVFGAGNSIEKQLAHVLQSFPSMNQLPPFYAELVRTLIDMDELRHALGAIDWAHGQIGKLTQEHLRRITAEKDFRKLEGIRRAFYGRVASTLKQINPELKELETVRKTLRELPTIKTGMPTVIIAGMPNVGKSTLLHALTGADPEVQPYPFTTQQLMLGYTTFNKQKVQFIDTPGVLERPAEKRNVIERRAALAIRHLASLVLFVIDPTLRCGYPLKDQLKLLAELRTEFDAPFLVIVNKADVATKEELSEVSEGVRVTATTGEGIEAIRKRIAVIAKKFSDAAEISEEVSDDEEA